MAFRAGKIITELGKSRLHDRINTILVAAAAIGISSTYIVDGKVDFKPGSYAAAASKLFNMDLRLPSVGPLEAAMNHKKPDRIELELVERPAVIRSYATTTFGLDVVISHIVSAAFVEFFESHKRWLRNKINKDPYKWPPLLNFGRVIRNAFGHGGMIDFLGKKDAVPVTWYGLTYGPADEGRKVLFNDLSFADILVLMVEMSEELDRINCPLL